MALDLLIPHNQKADNDSNPVHIIRDDRAISSRVLPAQDGIEDTPSTTTVETRVAIVNVPHALVDIIRAGSRTNFGCVAADGVVPVLGLEVPDCAREETGCYEIEDAGGNDEEELEFGGGAAPEKVSQSFS